MKVKSKNFKQTKYTCYFANIAMAASFSLPPLLFVTFREMYAISYTLLGTLVLTNFCTQLIVDLIFTFFTKYFNIHRTIRVMPLLTSAGMLIYALVPTFFPDKAYVGLVLGTVVFSIAAGLCEVLLSPLVAALPSDNPDRDMSRLHSLYAYGVLLVVTVSTLFLKFFGTQNWMYLTLFWAFLPLVVFALFCTSPLPDMNLTQTDGGAKRKWGFGMILCVLCIFLGSAAENTMTNWISGYLETALHLPKTVGDILGLALFAVLLGLGRTLYAKYGKNITKVLLVSMAGAAVCYLTAGLSPNAMLSLIACVLTGICTSMLWPGTLILMEEKFPNPGVAAYALMAAGGDFGASVAPQAMGIVVDKVAVSNFAADMSTRFAMTPDEVGMKVAMLCTAVFPALGVILLLYIIRYFKKREATKAK